jgi:hypothetical protein
LKDVDLITEKKQQKNMFYTLNRDKSLELVEFFEDIYDYNLKSLKEYVEGEEKKKKDLSLKKTIWIVDLDIYPWVSKARMMKIINAFQGMGDPMTEEETKNYMPSSDNSLLIPLGLIDEKGEPNIVPIAYYFDYLSNKFTLIQLCLRLMP